MGNPPWLTANTGSTPLHELPTRPRAQPALQLDAGLQARLRRIGVPPRKQASKASQLTKSQIASALEQHGSINATAKALDITRSALMAEAQRHGLRSALNIPADLFDRHQAGATQTDLATHYGVAVSTVGLWLQALGVARRRGRRPLDG